MTVDEDLFIIEMKSKLSNDSGWGSFYNWNLSCQMSVGEHLLLSMYGMYITESSHME